MKKFIRDQERDHKDTCSTYRNVTRRIILVAPEITPELILNEAKMAKKSLESDLDINELFTSTVEGLDGVKNEKKWTNAKITIFDAKDNVHIFRSGDGYHQFLVNRGRNGITFLSTQKEESNDDEEEDKPKMMEGKKVDDGKIKSNSNDDEEEDKPKMMEGKKVDDGKIKSNNTTKKEKETCRKETTRTILVASKITNELINTEIQNTEKLGNSDVKELLKEATINVEKIADETIWENAKITIYDSEDNVYIFRSGNGKHEYLVNRGELEHIDFITLQNDKVIN